MGYLEDVLRRHAPLSKLFSLPAMQVDFVEVDLLHAADLGILQYLLGNCLWEVWRYNFHGKISRPEATCTELLMVLRALMRARGDGQPLGGLSLNMIKRRGKPPKMRLKGSEARRLLPAALALLESLPARNAHERRLQRVQHALA